MNTTKVISVIGLGYIGLPTATLLAGRGCRVIGVDVNSDVVATINRGEIHIVEPDLDGLVHHVVQNGNLKAVLQPLMSDAFLIAVPTPFQGDHEPDVSYVKAATKSIAPVLKKGNLVILESTSPVGTTEDMGLWLTEERPDLSFPHQKGEDADVQLAYCPERVLPGNVIHELVENDRVIGGLTKKGTQMAIDLYRIFVKGRCIPTNARTAEMCKLTENSFRDVNIAFANELSMICDKLGIDVWELIALANHHPRVKILQPGPGVGGHCIAVDPWFIVAKTPNEAKLIHAARQVNDHKPHWVLHKVEDMISRIPAKPIKIGCLGLAFKANIDDLRESPAVGIVEKLADQAGVKVLAHEPNIQRLDKRLAAKGVVLAELEEIIHASDLVLVLVDHKEYREYDWSNMRKPLFDTRGIVRKKPDGLVKGN